MSKPATHEDIGRAVDDLEFRLRLEAAQDRARKYGDWIERFAVFGLGTAVGSWAVLIPTIIAG